MPFFSANIILVGYQEEDSSFSINDQVIMAKDRSATAYFLHTCKATLTCHHLINWHDNVSYISTFSRCKWRIHLDWSFWLVRNRNSLTALFLNSKKLQSYVAHTGTATSGGLITCDHWLFPRLQDQWQIIMTVFSVETLFIELHCWNVWSLT